VAHAEARSNAVKPKSSPAIADEFFKVCPRWWFLMADDLRVVVGLPSHGGCGKLKESLRVSRRPVMVRHSGKLVAGGCRCVVRDGTIRPSEPGQKVSEAPAPPKLPPPGSTPGPGSGEGSPRACGVRTASDAASSSTRCPPLSPKTGWAV